MARQEANASHQTTAFLDQGSKFEGTLTFQGAVRIDGVFKGDIVNGNQLILGEKADVEGTINVEEVIISGSFLGTITAAKSVTLHHTAVVEGSISTPRLGIDAGALFNGNVKMASGRKRENEPTDAELMQEGIKKLVKK